jgi:hypothetical protein
MMGEVFTQTHFPGYFQFLHDKWQEPSQDMSPSTGFQHHLLSEHPTAHPSLLPPTLFAEAKLHVCEQYDKLNIYQTHARRSTSHTKSKHTRTTTNFQLIKSNFRSLGNPEADQWLQSIQWLHQY